MRAARHAALLLLTVSALALAVPSAWAGFQQTPRKATSTFTTTTVAAPTIGTVTRCTLTLRVLVTWAASTTTFVSGQVAELSTSPTFATTTSSQTITGNTVQSATFTLISPVTTYYARVKATFQSWSATSAIKVDTVNAVC